MKFGNLKAGDFFLHDNRLFIKIKPVYVGFNHSLMTALEIETGNLWYVSYEVGVDKYPKV